jgi:hypothetical protein
LEKFRDETFFAVAAVKPAKRAAEDIFAVVHQIQVEISCYSLISFKAIL